MTVRQFDAPASTTPRCGYASQRCARSNGAARRIVRLIWLAAVLSCWGPVSSADYRRRFGVSKRSYRRDMRLLRRIDIYIDIVLYGKFRRQFYLWDSELA